MATATKIKPVSPTIIIYPGEYDLADNVLKFISDFCRAPDGKWAGQPIALRGWQIAFIKKLYKTRKGKRLVRLAILSMARKNGKSAIVGCLILAHLMGPVAVRNGSVYSAAKTRDQAAIVFRLAAGMVRLHPKLEARARVRDYVKEIFHPGSGSKYHALGADFVVAHGLSPSFAVHDELGQSGPVNPLYDAIESGMGAHEDPLSVVISTQAATNDALLSTLIDDALTNKDEATLIEIHRAPENCDIMDESAWREANPALGDFRSYDDVKGMAERAKRIPSFEPVFRNLILNQRVSAQRVFLPAAIWDQNSGMASMEDIEGRKAYCGLDLSSRTDITAFVINVPLDEEGHKAILSTFWMPEEGLKERQQKDRVPYQSWVDKGFIKLCPGATVNLDWVCKEIAVLTSRFEVVAVGFDRWRIEFFKQQMSNIDLLLPMVPFGQGYKDMSPALDQFEALAVEGKLLHGNNPVLRNHMANARVTPDPAGNRKLDKKASLSRIDGAVATAMALGVEIMPREEALTGSLFLV